MFAGLEVEKMVPSPSAWEDLPVGPTGAVPTLAQPRDKHQEAAQALCPDTQYSCPSQQHVCNQHYPCAHRDAVLSLCFLPSASPEAFSPEGTHGAYSQFQIHNGNELKLSSGR